MTGTRCNNRCPLTVINSGSPVPTLTPYNVPTPVCIKISLTTYGISIIAKPSSYRNFQGARPRKIPSLCLSKTQLT